MSKTKKTAEHIAPTVKKAKEAAMPDAIASAAAKPAKTSSNDVKGDAASPSTKKGKPVASKAEPATAAVPSKSSGSRTANVDPKPSKPGAMKPAQAEAAKGTTASASTAAKPKTTKQEQVLTLLLQKGGVTIDEVMKVTGWQQHSVRGFFAGTVRKKLGFELTSEKGEGDDRRYAIKVAA